MRNRLVVAVLMACGSGLIFAFPNRARAQPTQPALIPAEEGAAVPTPARIAALVEAGGAGQWTPVARAARSVAFDAFQKGRSNVAESWYYVYRWARLFGETDAQFFPRWIKAVNAARVGHANMPSQYSPTDRPLASRVSPELQAWLLGNTAYSHEFFSLLSPVDLVPTSLAILDELFRADRARFREYASLATAIAVVYDVLPPPHWPHGQVSAAALPRRWPKPSEAFAWWIREDRSGHTYHRLYRLGADELTHVVDASASFADLEWTHRVAAYPLAELEKAYLAVRYNVERARQVAYQWPAPSYALPEILNRGGICCDQAYFATQVGKARGVPTLILQGPGLDGRHAWFGFLDGNQQWQLGAGRYAEQRFITGIAQDPQTWGLLNDHEMRFLAERFRTLPTYRQSRLHQVFAEEMLGDGRAADAAVNARKAVNYERRNLNAWTLLIAAQQAQGLKPVALEGTMREAAFAFQRYPDLEMHFMKRVIESLRSRGETSQADAEERNLARKYQGERSDLTIRQAAERLERTFTTHSPGDQIKLYEQTLARYGAGAGMEFFDRVVVVFAEHLVQINERAAAIKAVERAREVLRVEPGRQLDESLSSLQQRLASGR